MYNSIDRTSTNILDDTADAPPWDAADRAAATVVGAIVPLRKFACVNGFCINFAATWQKIIFASYSFVETNLPNSFVALYRSPLLVVEL
jgi:hypothetical protein